MYICHFDCGISKMMGPKKQEFWPKFIISEVDHYIFVKTMNDSSGIILENKMCKELKLSKQMIMNKNVLLNYYIWVEEF